MKKNSKLGGLPLSEYVRTDPSKRTLINKWTKEHKRFLDNKEKSDENCRKVVNKERRKFLDMIKNAGIATPFVRNSSLVAGLLASRYAMAQNNPWSNKRVVYVYNSQGSSWDTWLPNNAGDMNWVSGPYGAEGVAGITNFRQINVHLQGHNSARQSMGDPQAQWHLHKPTFDERIANVIGATSPYGSMYIGADATLGMSRGEAPEIMTCSSLGIPIDGPQAAFDRFFNAEPPSREDRTFETMFSAHEKALASIKNKFGQEEIERMDKHGAAMAKIEARLDAATQGEPIDLNACRPNQNNGHDTVTAGKAQADIAAAALSCGLTNVVTLQIADNKGYHYVPDSGYGGEVHGGASHGGDRNAFNNVASYHQNVPAYMIKRLMETDGPDGQKLIDTTVVCVVNCMGDGMSHGPENSPWAMATRMSGFANGFSARGGGDCFDFHGAIPRGLGIPDNLYETAGGDTLDLLT